MREDERVTPLELFFDLVFVLALTQCTTLIADTPTWGGMLRGVLVLGMLWWSWTGYAWLTSVLDPEEGAVRLAIFAAMAAFLVAALCVPHAFGSEALLFACAYAVVRVAHIVLFMLASREDPALRRSVLTLAVSTAVGAGLLFAAAAASGELRVALWGVALLLDTGGPLLFGQEGWKLVPGHFAERHGLIVIIALGESIVSIGLGLSGVDLGTGEIVGAVLGVVIAACLWWTYFDVVAVVAEKTLRQATGIAQLKLARDSYSYLHLPMIAGIVLVALGIKKALGHVDDPLKTVPAFALCAGPALYYLAHVAFRWRNRHTLARRRIVVAALLLAFIPVATETSALVAVAGVAFVEVALLAYEVIRFRDSRSRLYASRRAEA
jgi:low temperature requirement protein LtrA